MTYGNTNPHKLPKCSITTSSRIQHNSKPYLKLNTISQQWRSIFHGEDLHEASETKLQINFENSHCILTLSLAPDLSGTAHECNLSLTRWSQETSVLCSVIYSVYIKHLDKHQEQVSHSKTRKTFTSIYARKYTGFEVQLPCSSDLNPSYFYLWGHFTPLVYSGPTENEETFYYCIFMPVKTICNCPGTFERVRRSMIRHEHVWH